MRGWRLAAASAGLFAVLCRAPAVRADPIAAASDADEWSPDVEARRTPHHLRSLLELGGGLTLGTAGYWAFMKRNIADWDNPRPWQRLDGDAWVLDNNSLGVNFFGHPVTGSLSYSFARGNHQSVAGAFGYSFLTSSLWEFVIEFKEKVSVNDVLVTPGAGLPIGEFFYKLGLYLDSGHQDSAAVELARWVLGTGVTLDRRLDGRAPPRVTAPDNLGFSPEIWHEFKARYGVLEVQTPREPRYALFHGSLAARLVTLRGYGKPRAFGRAFWGAELSRLSAGGEASRYGVGLAVTADTVLLGYHAQNLARAESVIVGEAVTVGSSIGYDYFQSSANRYASVDQAIAEPAPPIGYHYPTRLEQYAALQLPGVAADFRLLRRWGSVEVSGRLQPSFAGLGAAAFYDWAAANLDQRSKHILHRQGYFYAWGGAANLAASLAFGPLCAGFDVMYGRYRAQDGLDRHQEQLTVDVPASGDVLRYAGSLGIAPGARVSVGFELGVRRFRSNVGGFARTARAVQRGFSATWAF